MTWIAVAAGSAIGGMARYGVGLAVARLTGPGFPTGTLLINVVGSFIIGLYGAATMSGGPMPHPLALRSFVMVGFCGGFTTFSSFSLQTMELWQAGAAAAAAAYVALSVALCLAGVFLGYWLATRLPLPPG